MSWSEVRTRVFCSFCCGKSLTPFSVAMAKNRNKKKRRNDSTAMEISSDQTVADLAQAMDTSVSAAPNAPLGATNRKMKKGVQMKRSKNVRKMKAMAKAVSLNEKSLEKILKNESKTMRTKSAKNLYD